MQNSVLAFFLLEVGSFQSVACTVGGEQSAVDVKAISVLKDDRYCDWFLLSR